MMMKSQTKIDTKYYVNEEKRTVVCVLTVTDEILNKLHKYGLAEEYFQYFPYEPSVRKYTGIARCAPEDQFDVRYGKRLAEYRASHKRWKDVNRELLKYASETTARVKNLMNYGLLRMPTPPIEKED